MFLRLKMFYFTFEYAGMETKRNKKKLWTKPSFQILNIKKDTFSGSTSGPEGAGKGFPDPP